MASNSKLKKTLKSSPAVANKNGSEPSSPESTEQTPEVTEIETPETEIEEVEEIDETEEIDEDAENGAETGGETDLGPDDAQTAESPAEPQAAGETTAYVPDPSRQYAGGIPKGRIIPLGEEVTLDVEIVGTQAVIKEDTYKETLPTGSKRISFVRLYRAGQTIPATSIAATSSDEK